MALAEDESTPLLERVKFIAIVGNNLDEFYMVRVGAYFQRLHFNNPRTRPDGITPTQLCCRLIHDEVSALIARQRRSPPRIRLSSCWLARACRFISTGFNSAMRRARCHHLPISTPKVYPVLTPLAVDHARPFPFISNLSMNLGVYLDRVNGEHG